MLTFILETTMRAATSESRRNAPAAGAAAASGAVAKSRGRRGAASPAPGAVSAAEQAIRATGARVTQGRILVLEVLQAAGRALTHHEIEAAVAGPLDRVTVYRVLDWLTREQIAHKIPGDDRVWRFTIAGEKQAHHHAHFQCTDCSQVICLDDVPTSRPRLPAGYRSVGVEVTVKGQCKECVRPAPRRSRR
jgi:Fur family transcriptional regulator, ferric uptake regulator